MGRLICSVSVCVCVCGANRGSAPSSAVNLQPEGEAFSQISARTEQRGLRCHHLESSCCHELLTGTCSGGSRLLSGGLSPRVPRLLLKGDVLPYFPSAFYLHGCVSSCPSYHLFPSFVLHLVLFSAVSCFSHSFRSLPSPPLSFLLLVTISPQSIWNP